MRRLIARYGARIIDWLGIEYDEVKVIVIEGDMLKAIERGDVSMAVQIRHHPRHDVFVLQNPGMPQ